MRDYYKILGVKDTASMDEIRDRWIELMREFHPDQGKKIVEEEQERVKEINEAYQVLKHSSTRVEYDLKRTYEPKKGSFSLQKMVVPFAIIIGLIIIGAIFFNRPQDSRLSKPIPPSLEDPVAPAKSSSPGENTSGVKVPLASKSEAPTKTVKRAPHEEKKTVLNESSQVAQAELNSPPSQEAINVPSGEGSKGPPSIIIPSHPAEGARAAPNEASPAASSEESKKLTQSEISKPVLLEVKKTVPSEPSKVPSQEMAKAIPQPIPPVVQPTVQAKTPSSLPPKEQEMNLNKTNLPKPQEPEAVIPKQGADKLASMPRTEQMPRSLTPVEAFERKSVVFHPSVLHALVKAETQAGQSPTIALIAEEGEIRQFFKNYREKYIQRDAAGFLQLFSSKAIQNQKYRIDDIRRIYETFFNQSQDLHYLMEEVVIEIYQNAVEVRARYGVDQILKKGSEKKVWKGPIRWGLVKENGALKILLLDYQHIK